VTAFALSAVASLFAFGLAGCVATAQSPPARGVVVSGPPPAPLAEERAPQPRQDAPKDAQWVAGYWHWTGMQYAWIPGHWESAPPGAIWSAPRYSTADGSYFYEAGGWKAGAPSVPQLPVTAPVLAPAHANALR
jgi:hypothetical protein